MAASGKSDPLLGVSVPCINHILKTIIQGNGEWTTRDMCQLTVKPRLNQTLGPMVTLFHDMRDAKGRPFVRRANVYVVHSWGCSVKTVLEALVTWAERHKSKKEFYFWFDLFCRRQETVGVELSDTLTKFHRMIGDIGQMVVVLWPQYDPRVFHRMWCIYEMFYARKSHVPIEFIFSREETKLFTKAIKRESFTYWLMYSKVDASTSRIFIPDKQDFLQHIRSEFGFNEVSKTVAGINRNWLFHFCLSLYNESSRTVDDMWSGLQLCVLTLQLRGDCKAALKCLDESVGIAVEKSVREIQYWSSVVEWSFVLALKQHTPNNSVEMLLKVKNLRAMLDPTSLRLLKALLEMVNFRYSYAECELRAALEERPDYLTSYDDVTSAPASPITFENEYDSHSEDEVLSILSDSGYSEAEEFQTLEELNRKQVLGEKNSSILAMLYMGLGLMKLRQSHLKEACANLETALRLASLRSPLIIDIAMRLATVLERKCMYGRALETMGSVEQPFAAALHQFNPHLDVVHMYMHMGKLSLSRAQVCRAEHCFLRAADLVDTVELAHIGLQPEVKVLLGTVLLEQKKLDEAMHAFVEAKTMLEQRPECPENREHTADVQFYIALTFEAQKQLKEALHGQQDTIKIRHRATDSSDVLSMPSSSTCCLKDFVSYRKIGQLNCKLGNLIDSHNYYAKATEILELLEVTEAERVVLHSMVMLGTAETFMAEHLDYEASTLAEQARDHVVTQMSQTPDGPFKMCGDFYRELADLLDLWGMRFACREALKLAFSSYKSAVGVDGLETKQIEERLRPPRTRRLSINPDGLIQKQQRKLSARRESTSSNQSPAAISPLPDLPNFRRPSVSGATPFGVNLRERRTSVAF